MIPTNYYGAPTFNTFDARPFICQGNNCTEIEVQDNSYWATYLFENIKEVVINITKSNNSSATTGNLDITSDIIQTATGTVTTTGNTTVTGVGTTFTTEFVAGDYILIADTNQVIEIESIQSATVLTLVTWADTAAGSDIKKSYVKKTLTASDLGVSTITDGVYDVNYYITIDDGAGTETTFTYEDQMMFVCNVKCCVFAKLRQISVLYDCSNCDSDPIIEALVVKGLYDSMVAAMAVGDLISAETDLNKLIDICAQIDCGCN